MHRPSVPAGRAIEDRHRLGGQRPWSRPEFGFQQLFDLRNGPGKIFNLAGQPAQAGRKPRMRRQVEAWRRRDGDTPFDSPACTGANSG